jgi:tetratricopeptide (TPR) repeat protein
MGDRSKHFPTETAAMRVLTFSSSPRFDKSFTIGLWSVILFAAAEIFTASFYYLGRFHTAHADTTIPSTVLIPAPSAPPLTLKETSTAPAPTISVLAEPDRLLKDAIASRDKGDMTTALAKLQEAEQRDPKNASVLAEMANTYESMGLIDRSNETWRKVHELGPSAGDLFAVADKRLKIGVSATTAEATPAIPVTASLESGMARMNADGIPDNSTFGISDVKATESPDPDVETNLMLRISVKKRDNAVADHTKVKIQVFFYDTVDDKDIKLTDADVNYEWLTPKHDWTEMNPEILAVTYLRTKNHVLSPEAALSAAAAAVVPGKKNQSAKAKIPADGLAPDVGRRSYLGYIVRIYYHDQLQAVRASPQKLLSLFPTPSTAPTQ